MDRQQAISKAHLSFQLRWANNRHLPLIMVITCTMLYDPWSYGSFCILPSFLTMRHFDLQLWPPTLKNNRHLPLIMLMKCKLQDPGINDSVCILPTMYPATFSYLTFDIWLENRHLPLIMVINCIKLHVPGAYGSFCILPTTFSLCVTIQPWPLTSSLEKQ